MSEVFVEQIIKRRIRFSGIILRFISILAVIIAFFSVLVINVLGLTLAALLIYVAYLVWSYTSVEYEYSFLNGELSVDKIMGQRKRKKLAEYDIKNAEIVAPSYSEELIRAIGNAKMIDYSSGYKSDKFYSILINDQSGRLQVVFEPNEKVLDAMYHVRPNIVKKD